MVGVPGRSKGCNTCLKRRIKCDEKRPTCGRCTKAGYKCLGYNRAFEIRSHSFTNNGKETKMLTSNQTKVKANARSASVVMILDPNNPDLPTKQAVPRELSLVAFKDDLEFSYLLDNFVWRTYGYPWLEMSAKGKMGRLSLDACRGFAQSVFGKHHRLNDIQLQGQILYGHTIRGLSQELCHAGKPGFEMLIIPILLLLMHPSTAGDPQASLFHTSGLTKVITSCGPARFAKMPVRLAFESARSTLFTASLVSKRRTFFELAAWKTEPWRGIGSPPKTPQNELFDFLVNIPGYLQDASEIDHETAAAARLATLIDRVRSDLASLYQWRWNWEKKNPRAAWEIDSCKISSRKAVCHRRIFPKVFWFRSFTCATEILLYNTALLYLLGLLWQFGYEDEIQPTVESSSPLHLPGQYTSLYEPAEEICRVFEYQLLNVRITQESALLWMFPIAVAQKILEGNPKYGACIRNMLDIPKTTWGYGSGSPEFSFVHQHFPTIYPPQRGIFSNT